MLENLSSLLCPCRGLRWDSGERHHYVLYNLGRRSTFGLSWATPIELVEGDDAVVPEVDGVTNGTFRC